MREKNVAYYRPEQRRLSELSNEELRALFEIRARNAAAELKPDGFWQDDRIVYWGVMPRKLLDLYEVMLEIQARYPLEEICKYDGFDPQLLPVPERAWIEKSLAHAERQYGLKELPGGRE